MIRTPRLPLVYALTTQGEDLAEAWGRWAGIAACGRCNNRIRNGSAFISAILASSPPRARLGEAVLVSHRLRRRVPEILLQASGERSSLHKYWLIPER